MRKIQAWLLGVIFFYLPLASEIKQLSQLDIRPTMADIFSYHVEFKTISPLIVKRSFKVFIDEFDPEKLYLLQEEVKPFLEQTPEKLQNVVNRYFRDEFPDYIALSKVIQKAIFRARDIRQEIQRELILSSQEPELIAGESHVFFSEGIDQLKERIRKQMMRLLAVERKQAKSKAWTVKQREKIFSFWDKRYQHVEKAYLVFDENGELYPKEAGEHYLAMHILKAMARSLDAHTVYFTPQEAYEMRASLEKEFEGVGIILKESIDGIVIVDLVKGGPAAKSSLVRKGDFLVELDEKPLENIPYEEVLENLKGSGKKEVILGLRRYDQEGKASDHKVRLLREKIVMENERLQYSFEPFGNGIIGKLNLPSFYESGANSSCELEMREALRSLKRKGKLLGLVLDLRENAGGFLSQAVKVTGLFITSGVIVISKYAEGEIQYLRDIDGRVFFNGPLIILTSKASASAAEIVAQALQDYGAALIVGDERTYGKGTIQYQTVTDTDASAYFKVTVGRYYTVSGKSTQIDGVKADIVVPTEYSVYNIGERFLEYPLKGDRVTSAYVDPLTDVDPKSKRWFQKNYLPNLQVKRTQWNKMLPILMQNSSYRLENDKNFKLFLETIHYKDEAQKSFSPTKDLKKNWGIEDLQMGEAVQILKDMILLQQKETQK